MGRLDEIVSEQFTRWEQRGRGWQVWPYPVTPEPPFSPFVGFRLPPASPQSDDGRKPGMLASLFDSLHSRLEPKPPTLPPIEEDEPQPEALQRSSLITLHISLPKDFIAPKHAFDQFLQSVSFARDSFCFEMLGLSDRITTQLAVTREDLPLVREQMQATFPDVILTPQVNEIAGAWNEGDGGESAIAEFGLARQFVFPLAACKRDPFVGIAAAMQELSAGELGLFQVLFEPVRQPWGENVVRAVTDTEGKPLFQNFPELFAATKQKAAQTLYAAVVRVATRAAVFDRAWAIARNLAATLRVFASPTGNELIPLLNDDYPFEVHADDVLRRQTHRSGMILTRDELMGFVHLPSAEVRSPKLGREMGKTKSAPAELQAGRGLLLGFNSHAGRTVEIRLAPDQRVRHMHLIGVHGTGKSTLLFNLIIQDIEKGEGVAVLDPHGDLIDRVLGNIPEHRIKDVILFDASDEEYSIPFNILSAHSDLEKNLLASDLISVFERLSTSWGDQMASVLRNGILAFLESSRGGTLDDLRRFLLDARFREEFLQTVRDPAIVFYWRRAFAQLTGNKSVGPVLTRLDEFLAPKTIRYMVSQPVNRLDFAQIMDTGKVFLARLPQGQIGKENAFLLGSLLVTKFQQTTMSRQALEAKHRRDFWLYVDEFQNFITPSMTEILTGARKYRLGLVLAHQELQQLERDREVASAVSHCCTRVVFRVGDDDARKLADGFASFDARDLQNLPTGQAICRVERSDCDFNLSIPQPDQEDSAKAATLRRRIITVSREKYATPRAEVEAMLLKTAGPQERPTPPITPKPLPAPAVPPVAEPPKQSEVPKITVSEKEEAVIPPTPEPPRDLGRGGAQHKAIQERIQAEAHALGFLAAVEGQLAGTSNQAADLVLRKGSETIAVEISVTTTVDHEFGNVKKCLVAGFNRVAVVSHRPEHLKAIAEAVNAGLGLEQAANVGYHSPDEFIAELRRLAPSMKESPREHESTTRGYKVRGHSPTLTASERKAKETVAIKLMAEAMKRRP